jgi:predicted murein hydrolase (TIGR00659 family)
MWFQDPVILVIKSSPLFSVTATLLAYGFSLWLYKKFKYNPLVNPILISIVLVSAALLLFDVPYEKYNSGTQLIQFLLGPATVALAVPLYRQWPRIKRHLFSITCSLLVGSAVAIASAVGIGYLFGFSNQLLISLAPKSATTAIALGISEKMGGQITMTAIIVVVTGISGAMMAKFVLDFLLIRSHEARGFAIGLASHGVGTARAFNVSEVAGTYASLAMALNGVLTAIALPLVWWLMK